MRVHTIQQERALSATSPEQKIESEQMILQSAGERCVVFSCPVSTCRFDIEEPGQQTIRI
jgi:hypothetical protein